MTFLDANDGQPGVVYILANGAFRDGVVKIGQSTRSGHVRATDLNRDAGTGIPKMFKCIYEVRTLDCGRAEKHVHAKLHRHRLTNQEYFDVDLELAKQVVAEACAKFNADRALVVRDLTKPAKFPVIGKPPDARAFRLWSAATVGAVMGVMSHGALGVDWSTAAAIGGVCILALEIMAFMA